MNAKAHTVRIWKDDTEIVFYFVGEAPGGPVTVHSHEAGDMVSGTEQYTYEKATELLTEHIREGYTVVPVTPGY